MSVQNLGKVATPLSWTVSLHVDVAPYDANSVFLYNVSSQKCTSSLRKAPYRVESHQRKVLRKQSKQISVIAVNSIKRVSRSRFHRDILGSKSPTHLLKLHFTGGSLGFILKSQNSTACPSLSYLRTQPPAVSVLCRRFRDSLCLVARENKVMAGLRCVPHIFRVVTVMASWLRSDLCIHCFASQGASFVPTQCISMPPRMLVIWLTAETSR
jgi:hypothetical protein